MALIAADAILTRIREACEDGVGSIRVIASTRYYGGAAFDLDDSEESLRGMERPRVEARIGQVRRHTSTPSITSNLALYELDVVVRVVRHLAPDHKLDDDLRDDVKALALEDADVLNQALTWPGNLTTTTGGTATGLISGMLRYASSDPPIIAQLSTGARIVTEHRFTGIAQVAPAVS